MGFINEFLASKNYIILVEALTILAACVLAGYFFYTLKLYKKD